MDESPQCDETLTARDGSGATILIYCIKDAGHADMHRGEVLWSSPYWPSTPGPEHDTADE